MIQSPGILLAVLTSMVAAVLAARRRSFFAPAFRFLPVPFWCYFLPMILATFGFFPAESPLYAFLSRTALPLCLALMLIDVDISALAGLSRQAALVMATGMAGIMLGAVVSFAIFHPHLPAEAWKAVGALSGSWIGGSANMLALKEALGTPENVFAPVVIVDTLLAYGWMALLVFGAGFQDRFDAAQGLSRSSLTPSPAPSPKRRGDEHFSSANKIFSPLPWGEGTGEGVRIGMVIAFILAGCSIFIGGRLPAVGSVLTKTTWTVLLVTTGALAFSYVHHGRFRPEASQRLEGTGTTILYILLASMGARARLTAIVEAPLFLALGAVWISLHGAVLLAAGRLLKAPMFLLATASQACVGGTVSAPLVAAVYRPALAAVGLLLAVLGNVLGTYLGLITAKVCEWIAK